MASIFARHAVSSIRAARYVQCVRAIHATPVALKRKKGAVIEDLFGDSGTLDDILPHEEEISEDQQVLTEAKPKNEVTKKRARSHLSTAERDEQFDTLFQYLLPRVGKHPEIRLPLMRSSVWTNLFGLATTEAQLTKVAEQFPQWKEGGKRLRDRQTEHFITRCGELKCPQLALKIFGDFQTYSVPMTLTGARKLMHYLAQQRPLSEVMTLTTFLPLYQLPFITADIYFCAEVCSACVKDGSPDALALVDTLMPKLQELLKKNKKFRVPQKLVFSGSKEKVWVRAGLRSIDHSRVTRLQQRDTWLKVWRERNKHIIPQETAVFKSIPITA